MTSFLMNLMKGQLRTPRRPTDVPDSYHSTPQHSRYTRLPDASNISPPPPTHRITERRGTLLLPTLDSSGQLRLNPAEHVRTPEGRENAPSTLAPAFRRGGAVLPVSGMFATAPLDVFQWPL